jgi:hypothetical protein
MRFGILLLLSLALMGCETTPEPTPASRQQAQADLVINFQSWNSISFIKPDVTGTANTLAFRRKTFTRSAVEKLMNNLQMPRDIAVVILDRQYSPDPMVAGGGIDEIQKFFQGLGFRRIAFHEAIGGSREPMRILRDTGAAPIR